MPLMMQRPTAAPRPSNPLFAAIAARRQQSEARMQKIASGELTVEDPRAARERELKAAQQAKLRRL